MPTFARSFMRVLLIFTDDLVDDAVLHTIEHSDCDVIAAASDSYLEHSVVSDAYDLIVVDMHRTGLGRWSTLTRLRSHAPGATILLLTASSDAGERILGLDAGADDCLSRPFDPIELRARVRALSRRGRTEVLHFGNLEWDWEHRQGSVDSVLLALSRYETVLLEALLKSPNHIIPLEVLAQRIETVGGPQANNRLYVYISRLRKKLSASNVRIRSSSGLGYFVEFDH
jgi:DNA-binding response OmpR family regulator